MLCTGLLKNRLQEVGTIEIEIQQTYDLQTSKHRRGEKGRSPLQWRKPAYGESSWRGGDICVGVLAQAESGPKFSQVMRANSTEAGSS